MNRFSRSIVSLILVTAAVSVGTAAIALVQDSNDTYTVTVEAVQAAKWELDLYYRVDCPYSQKVIRYLNQNGIAINMRDVQRDELFFEELKEIAGTTQAPCLVINGEPLVESDEIIRWLEENIAHPLAG